LDVRRAAAPHAAPLTALQGRTIAPLPPLARGCYGPTARRSAGAPPRACRDAGALKLNSSLQNLNLRLNRLGDEGGKMLLDGMLVRRRTSRLAAPPRAAAAVMLHPHPPHHRTISSSRSTSTSVLRRSRASPASSGQDNSTLTQLNLSCNALEFDSAQTVGAIVSSNTSLRTLDLSCNVLSEEATQQPRPKR
jgi:Leucine-rich repeat (LRR) protein